MLDPSVIERQVSTLRKEGYVVVRDLVDAGRCAQLRRCAVQALKAGASPAEYESDLRYPGAPTARGAPGGGTVRRLLDAYARDPLLREWASSPEIAQWMAAYFGEPVIMSRAHHNCIMTKHPKYGSLTGWHRDIRYWSFGKPDLVSTWLALGPENSENGGLYLVPASHALRLAPEAFDAKQFFLAEPPANAVLIAQAIAIELKAGDVLFFHCNTLHAAGQNQSDRVKFSIVHTYHALSNPPLAGTRSASKPEVPLSVPVS